jgi:hypothetical protein
MEHPAPDFHVELSYRNELTYRSAISPACPDVELVLCIASLMHWLGSQNRALPFV